MFNEYLFHFTLYSFFGWILENSYSFFVQRVFLKENFLVGPFKPMYGFAPILLVWTITPRIPLLLVLFLCLAIPLLVEYVSGLMLDRIFHKRYWDYSNQRFQLHSYICFNFALCWIFLSYGIIAWMHPMVQRLYDALAMDWVRIAPFYVLYFIIEFLWAVQRHRRFTLIKQTSF